MSLETKTNTDDIFDEILNLEENLIEQGYSVSLIFAAIILINN
jgi:hypothetical protein